MLFDLPNNPLEGFTEKEYKDAQKNKYMKIVIVLMQLQNMLQIYLLKMQSVYGPTERLDLHYGLARRLQSK